MAKPEREGGRGYCLVTLGTALLAVAFLAAGVVWLDARRSDHMTELKDQLLELRQLVDTLQKQLDQHEQSINSTLTTKSTTKSEPAEEVVYEDEYEYDEEEGSYEYDVAPNTEGMVKRTTVLGDKTPNKNLTRSVTSPRTKRDLRAQVREESATEPLRNQNQPSHEINSQQRRHQQVHERNQPEVYQEQRRPEETVVRLRHGGRNRHVNKEDVELLSQNSAEEFVPPRGPNWHQLDMVAAHFVGDVTKYNSRDHSYYSGNNIMYHPHGLFKDWVPADWMFNLGTYSHFPMHDGKLSIQKPGIYFVYAQVYYAATHDRCGFHIKHNGDEVAQCSVMSSGRVVKRNTCFTGVLLHLRQSDQVYVSEVEGFRNTSFKGSHSFFGLVQLRAT